MNTHVTEWLSAYYDGELPGTRQGQVEEHLNNCPLCRAELEELYKLSQMLLEVPSPDRVLAVQRFDSKVFMSLPPTVPQPVWQRALKAGWQFAPLAAVFVWVFIQTALLMAGLAGPELPVGFGFGGGLSGWLNLAGTSLRFARVEAAIELGLLNLALSALVVVFLCGWFASWWVFQRSMQKATNLIAV